MEKSHRRSEASKDHDFYLFLRLIVDSAIWIIRQYGSTIGQNAASICASPAFICSSGQLINVKISKETTTFTSTGLVPDSSLTSLTLPECTQFDILPISLYRGDPNQSILTRLTNVPKVASLNMEDDVISNIPIGFLKPFTQLMSMVLSFGNVTSIQEASFEVTSTTPQNAYLTFIALKSYPWFSNSSASLVWRTLNLLSMNINSSAADAPISLTFSPTVFPKLQLLQLTNLEAPTITVTASFLNILLLAKYTNGFALTVPNPGKVAFLRMDGKTTVSPPLEQFVNLTGLTAAFFDSNIYPFTTFPPKLAKFSKLNSVMTTLPTSPPPPASFKEWIYQSIIGPVVIPWEALTPDNTSRLLDISNNPSLGGSVPDSFCINRINIINTNIGSIPNCYWCYYNDVSVIRTDLPLPAGFTCQPTIDQTTVYTKGFKTNITGNLLGYGINQTSYTLTPVVPHKILTLFYPTNGQEQILSFKLNENQGYTVTLSVLEVGIILTSVTADQQPNQKVLFTWSFLFYNNNLQHQFIASGRNCAIVRTQYNSVTGSSSVTCELDINQLNTATYTFMVSNAHNQETFIVPFKYYPRLFSGQVDSNNQSLIYLFGDFRQNHSLVNITINSKIQCSVVSSTVDSINCTLSESAGYGLASVSIGVDGYPFEAKDFLYFTAPNNNNNGSTTTTTTGGGSTTPQSQCQSSTSNCYGHGSCDVKGHCQCDSGYNPLDNCLTKFTNTTPTTNSTAPTSSFEIDGTKFDFELVAIQEIDNDGNVVAELMTNSWNATINSDSSTTLVNYQLVNISNVLYIDTIVEAMISFSSQARDIQFGDQLLHINPNSIKLALNITNWQYSNLISTLRVVFRTDVNMNQTIEYDCKQQSISTFSYDQLSSTIQYLRVIKDNVQYNGRFIDYVLSDGRPTFSKTTLINQTTSQQSSTTMSTLIGVSLPQCQSCLLDPDFTPLFIDNSQSECDSTNSKTWKIIVGVVVGGSVLLAAIVGCAIYLKNSNFKYSKPIIFMKALKNKSTTITTAQGIPASELNSAIWIIRQYGSTIVQEEAIICASPAFICSGGHIVNVLVNAATTTYSASGGTGMPDPLLTVIDLPQCTRFDVQQTIPYIADRKQSLLDKLTGLPNLATSSIYEQSIPNIPVGYLRYFPKMTSMTLILPNVTAFHESSFEITSPSIASMTLQLSNLKNFPSFTNSSTSLVWSSLKTFVWGINPSFAVAPISLDMPPTVFAQLQTLQIDMITAGLVTIAVSCKTMNFNGLATNRYNLTVQRPEVVETLILSGISTVSPPLHLFTNLLTLTTNYPNTITYPFSIFPPKLQKITKFDDFMTTLPTTPLPTSNFKWWQYRSLTELTIIPWEGLAPDNTTRLLDINYNNKVAGSVPDSFCVNKLWITSTNISSVPNCFWCYRQDTTIFQTSLSLPTGFTCTPTIDQTIVYTKKYRGILTGNLLGWGNGIDSPALIPIIPHKMFELYYPTNGFITNTTIQLNSKAPYLVNVNVLEVGITVSTANVTQLLNQKVQFIWLFYYYNSQLVHQFQSVSGLLNSTCVIVASQYTPIELIQATITCQMDFNPSIHSGSSFGFEISNDHNKEFYSIPFTYYPRLLSGQVDSNNQSLIYLFGDFRQNHSLANITINDKIQCSVLSSTVDSINCTLSENANYGPASVRILVDGYPFEAKDFLYFKNNNNNGSTTTGSTTTTTGTTTSGGGPTPQSQCQVSTSNCYGHGSCDVNGHCQCDSGYNPLDNCLTKFTNSTPTTNSTAPTSSFEIDGTKFDFELVAIQELDTDGMVIAELMTNSWNTTINSDSSTTLVNYQLVNISNVLYIDTIVEAMISFSSQARDIQFGDQLLHINPNSIKLSLNITNWQYSNLISTLRVVFRTDVNMNQTIEYDCKQQSISTFSYDQLSSTIQYLRVIKDNVQYNGRFIDYVLSDGRPTFSKTTLINQTTSQQSSTTMSTLIGVSLPQCQSCLLDPDFTPLLIDKSESDCGSSSSNSTTWKIIVGVVVGGFAAIAIALGTVMLIKKNRIISRQNKKMQNKLKNMDM
ncbi:hypothetical protein DFA_07013 [Cavenderia fasciculata]|uniref:EGF-like domain-containing protein n=1 Tax=Cavenderia fasciculata TaxID=261658 RepID=F4PXA5_CACFS|nr:uncharacterized protein DFA_07013 [Cavenderia fasciculata]EGG19908.1 hypothetical protein DFA_07013 [Cavenderia fasciculata]|eukprot:XP_004366891.1 hypothetical protein DFA_07013 [Cavenderia fasciculata]